MITVESRNLGYPSHSPVIVFFLWFTALIKIESQKKIMLIFSIAQVLAQLMKYINNSLIFHIFKYWIVINHG